MFGAATWHGYNELYGKLNDNPTKNWYEEMLNGVLPVLDEGTPSFSPFFASFSVSFVNPNSCFIESTILGINPVINKVIPAIIPTGPNIDPANKSIPVSSEGHQSFINLKILLIILNRYFNFSLKTVSK